MADISLSSSTGYGDVFRDDAIESNKFLDEALEQDKREGQILAIKARSISLAVIGLFLIYLLQDFSVIYYEVLIGAFMLNGWAQLRVAKVGKSRAELFLMFVDLALMTIILVVPNPFDDRLWSVAMQYKFANFPYFYVLLAAATLAYSWRTMFAVATWTSGLWMAGYFWAINQEDTAPQVTAKVREALVDYPNFLDVLDPNHILLESRIQDILLFLIVAAILALNSWRARKLLIRQSDAARERANLARHFAPNIVDHLAGRDQPLGEVRSQSVVVMFVDIVGFTNMAEQGTPEQVVALLRDFHSRMETAVFDHNGTLDKFLGDGLMVIFGTPDPSPDDAKNAINCALAMQNEMKEWNEARVQQGRQPIRLSIGLHAGEVVLGDIGSARRLEFAVLGDVVNVSSRLEALTRTLDALVVASDDVIEAVGGAEKMAGSGMVSLGPQQIRGREEPVPVWALKMPNTA
jgi:adenylate cyclase